MSTERLNTTPAMLVRIVAERLWGESPFFLIDVGASGGIERHWAVFGDRLRAIGFEPLVAEAARLQQRSAGTKVSYEAAFVTCRHFDQLFPPELRNDRIRSKNNDPFPRVSAARAQELMRMNYAESVSVFNTGDAPTFTDRAVVLDDFIPASEHPSVDFLKIDTDGHDIEVLLGADGLLRRGGGLGLSIEAQFHGAVHDQANTFANIDRFMRGHGFSLFDLEVYRYSRSTLPAPFVYDIPAQTTTGQVLWGEALYLRDLANPDYERMWEYEITRERVFKLACVFELFGMPDCAAELLINRREIVGGVSDSLLDQLADPGSSSPGSYREYINAFEADPEALYRRRRRAAAEAPGQSRAAAPAPSAEEPPSSITEPAERAALVEELERLRSQVSRLKKKTSDLLDRVKRRDEQIEQLTKQAR
jgi:FkbM family methyltransferase